MKTIFASCLIFLFASAVLAADIRSIEQASRYNALESGYTSNVPLAAGTAYNATTYLHPTALYLRISCGENSFVPFRYDQFATASFPAVTNGTSSVLGEQGRIIKLKESWTNFSIISRFASNCTIEQWSK